MPKVPGAGGEWGDKGEMWWMHHRLNGLKETIGQEASVCSSWGQKRVRL